MRKLEGNILLGRPRCGWEDNIKMDLHKVGCGMGNGREAGMDWIDLRAP